MNKDILDDIGRKLSGAADTVSRKAEELAEFTRLKNQIYSLERDIRRDYEALGKQIYESYVQTGTAEEPLLSICEEIARKEILIDQYQGEIDERKKGV